VPQAERARRSAEDRCIECHMPVYGASDIPHTAVTDHRIPRDSKTPASPPKVGPVDPGTPGPLISFYRGRSGVDAADDDRCRAVALTRLMLTGDGAARRAVRQAMPALDSALRRDPDDLPAREALGYVLVAQDRTAEALEAFQAVLATAPEQEIALTGAALTAETMGHTGVALGYWRRAVAVNPWAPTYRQRLAQLLLKQEDWDAALPECEAWKRLDPMSAPARMARVSCLLATGNKQEARAEFARVVALAPANLRELHIRFDKKLK